MDKEEALKSFFKSLKLSLKNASIYTSKHPSFKKSVNEVKEKIDTLLNYSSPIRIGVTPRSLQVEGQYFEEENIHEELAQILHLHIIKSLEIQEGITPEELVAFIKKVYLAPTDILKKGGLSQILEEENITHLAVEELDYSQLLKGEGDEIKDIWSHLLQDAIKKEDGKKISELAENFEKVADHIKIEELLDNEQFRRSIDNFFTQLKSMDKDKFQQCSKELLKSILRYKSIPRETNLQKLRKFFKDMNNEDMASTLLEEILTDDEFNTLSFRIFSELSERRRHKGIADSFGKQFKKESAIQLSPDVRQKIKELLTGSGSQIISEIYRQTLSSLLTDMATEEKISLDINHLQKNYRYFLLSLLDEEEKKKRLVSILEKILVEWDNILQERDLDYLRQFLQVLGKRRKELTYEPALAKANAKVVSFVVDEAAREEDTSSQLEPFIAYLKGGFLSSKAFLIKMFGESKINTQILEYFFELHPDNLNLFKKNLRERYADTEFLKTTIVSLGKINTPLFQEILNDILSYGPEATKIEALKIQQLSSMHDENRLFRILEGGSSPLKKEALEILARKKISREKALENLFSVPSPFGTKNNILIEHINIIKDIDLKEAKEFLTVFSKKKFFWNKKLKEEALKVLKEWDARENQKSFN